MKKQTFPDRTLFVAESFHADRFQFPDHEDAYLWKVLLRPSEASALHEIT